MSRVLDHCFLPCLIRVQVAGDYPALGGTFGAVYGDIPGEDNFEGNSAKYVDTNVTVCYN